MKRKIKKSSPDFTPGRGHGDICCMFADLSLILIKQHTKSVP